VHRHEEGCLKLWPHAAHIKPLQRLAFHDFCTSLRTPVEAKPHQFNDLSSKGAVFYLATCYRYRLRTVFVYYISSDDA
jgi:hypothetical protein